MSVASSSHEQVSQSSSPCDENRVQSHLIGKHDTENNAKLLEGMVMQNHTRMGGFPGGILGPDAVISTSKGDRYVISRNW